MSTQVKAIIAGVVIVGVLAFSLHYTSSRRKAGPAELGEGAPAETAKTSGYGVDEKEGAISSGEDDAVRGKQPKVETSKSETTGEKSAKKDIAAAPSAVEKTGVSPSGEAASELRVGREWKIAGLRTLDQASE